MTGRASCDFRFHSIEAQLAKVKIVDIDIDDANGIILRNIIIKQFEKQGAQASAFALDKPLHVNTHRMRYSHNVLPIFLLTP